MAEIVELKYTNTGQIYDEFYEIYRKYTDRNLIAYHKDLDINVRKFIETISANKSDVNKVKDLAQSFDYVTVLRLMLVALDDVQTLKGIKNISREIQ